MFDPVPHRSESHPQGSPLPQAKAATAAPAAASSPPAGSPASASPCPRWPSPEPSSHPPEHPLSSSHPHRSPEKSSYPCNHMTVHRSGPTKVLSPGALSESLAYSAFAFSNANHRLTAINSLDAPCCTVAPARVRSRAHRRLPGRDHPLRTTLSRKEGHIPFAESYFLADRTIPWWAIALSIVSAETSTLTIISVPGLAFAGNFGFLQIVFGYMVGRIVVALLFLPKYFQGQMLTAYQLIDRRFGSALHKTTAGLFLITRAAAEGVRVFAVSIVVAIAIGT